MQRFSIELRVGIVPYSKEEDLPQTTTGAFSDLVKYAATLQPRAEVIRLVTEMELASIIMATKGLFVYPSLNDFEHYAMYTLNYCQQKGWLTTDDQAVTTIRSVKQEVLRSNLFSSIHAY